jgi:hypothetical protein
MGLTAQIHFKGVLPEGKVHGRKNLVVTGAGLKIMEKRQISLPLPGIETRFLDLQTMSTELSW